MFRNIISEQDIRHSGFSFKAFGSIRKPFVPIFCALQPKLFVVIM